MTTEISKIKIMWLIQKDHGNFQDQNLRLIQNDHGNFQDQNLRLIQNNHGNFQDQTQTTMEIFKIKFAVNQK